MFKTFEFDGTVPLSQVLKALSLVVDIVELLTYLAIYIIGILKTPYSSKIDLFFFIQKWVLIRS